MYLYFNNQGVLKEIVNDEAIRQGNSRINKIRFFIEGAEPQIVDNVYKALTFITGIRTFIDVEGNPIETVDIENNTSTTEQFSLQTEELEVPYNKKRELKFFKYFTKYEMFSITVPDDVLNINGTVGCRVQMISAEGITTLGLIVFNVEGTGTDAVISPDTAINIAQWNYLITHMTTPENFVMKYDANAGEWDVVPTQGSTRPVTSGGVATAIANALSAVYKIQGSAEVSYLEDLEKTEALNGYVYNLSDEGTLTNEDGTTISVREGDNIVFVWHDSEWYWDKIGSSIDTSDLATKSGNNTFTGQNTFTGVTYIGSGSQVTQSADGNLQITLSGNGKSFKPSWDGHYDLGTSGYRWRDIHIKEHIYLGDTTTAGEGNIWFKNPDLGNQGNWYITSPDQTGIEFRQDTQGTGIKMSRGTFYPLTNAYYTLGSSSYQWKTLYLSHYVAWGNNVLIGKDGSNRFYITASDGNTKIKVGINETYFANHVEPDANNTYNLGRAGMKWNTTYTRYLNDDSVNIAVSDIASKIDTNDVIDLGTFDANGEITYDIDTLKQDIDYIGYDYGIHGMFMLTYLYAQAIIYLDETQIATASAAGHPVRAPMPVVYDALHSYSVPGNIRVQKVGTNLIFKVSDGNLNAAQGQHMYLIPTKLVK